MIIGVNEILNEDLTIITLVGLNAAATKTKVFPIAAPSGESLPYITTSLAQFGTTNSKQIVSNNLDYPTVAIHVHADSYDKMVEISERVVAIFDHSGFVTDAGYVFEKTWIINQYDRPELFVKDNPSYTRTILVSAQLRRN